MVYDENKLTEEHKWLKDIKKFVKKQKWSREEAIKYLRLASTAYESEIATAIREDEDFLASFDNDDEVEVLTQDDILSETIILSQDGEGHN